ncbi:hypothetical protein QP794_10505 [Paenibacillus sp. UMB7766-LJ446]|uniref:hypothetical protein n=1 Tax=Paenibacillus sp. UMB7766-LJ446 TaxID=3046313 RepID=UPI00254E9119|nr:hypothetical protein [Paenibacillus sp. UMB7766-LJ446]MDK8190518.1 hypothetical protein [Paenibacillus sp. UMB7766-LJ446]
MSGLFLSSVLIMGCTSSETTEILQETPPASEQLSIVTNQKASAEDEQQALEMALEYKETELTVDYKDYEDTLTMEGLLAKGETMKPFLTTKNYEAYMANRYITLPLLVADKEKALLRPEDIQAKIKESKSDWILVEYTLDLIFTDEDGKEMKTIPLSGEITFLQEQGEWRIQDDTYNMKAFLEIINKSL